VGKESAHKYLLRGIFVTLKNLVTLAELVCDGTGERGLLGAGMESGHSFDEGDPGLFCCGGVVTNASGDDEELAGPQRDGAAVCFGAADAEETTEDKEHLVLVFMVVPGKFSLYLDDLDVLVVDLTDDSR
jgi:hypothetical protein